MSLTKPVRIAVMSTSLLLKPVLHLPVNSTIIKHSSIRIIFTAMCLIMDRASIVFKLLLETKAGVSLKHRLGGISHHLKQKVSLRGKVGRHKEGA